MTHAVDRAEATKGIAMMSDEQLVTTYAMYSVRLYEMMQGKEMGISITDETWLRNLVKDELLRRMAR